MIIRSGNMRRGSEEATPRRELDGLLRLFERSARKSPEELAAIALEVTDALRAFAERLLRQRGCPNPEIDALEVSQSWWVNILKHGPQAIRSGPRLLSVRPSDRAKRLQ